jgi:hypothetical protein
MKRSVIISLSRQEEDILRLVAHGISSLKHLPADDVDQLARLGLVEQQGGKVTLTGLGQVRLAQSQELQFLSIIRAARQQPTALTA